MKALKAAAILVGAVVDGKLEFGLKDDGKTLSVHYTGLDEKDEGEVLAAVLHLATLDGIKLRDLKTDNVHIGSDTSGTTSKEDE